MQEIMLHCFQSVRYKLDRKLGYFDLLGFDFMLDENLNVSTGVKACMGQSDAKRRYFAF